MRAVTMIDIVEGVTDQGFAVWPDLLDPDALTRTAAAAKELVTGEHAHAYPKSTRVWDLYRHGQPFIDILNNNALDHVVTTLLGQHYLLSDYSLNVVHPNQPIDDWHVDYPYNEMPNLVTGSLLGLQCVLALDDFDVTNGATQLIPESHRPPRRPADLPGAPHVTFCASAGSLLLMAAATWHRSGFNQSSRARTAVLLSFVERWVRPMTGPPEPGPWATTDRARIMLGLQRPPETINGVPI